MHIFYKMHVNVALKKLANLQTKKNKNKNENENKNKNMPRTRTRTRTYANIKLNKFQKYKY